MRKTVVITAALAVLATAPLAAQGRGGGAGGGGAGGPGAGAAGGMGGGPPMSPPGLAGGGPGTADLAHGIASQKGQFGRDFASTQKLTPEERSARAAEYQAEAQQRRADAMVWAQAARAGRPLPTNADRDIRAAMKADMEAWREAFNVGRTDWQAMRDQWLVDRDTLTPQEWAQRRVDWFAARDAWISSQKAWAMAHRPQ